MSSYPKIITNEVLQNTAHLTSAEILQDIRDTNAEIAVEKRKIQALSLLTEIDHDRMTSSRADVYRRGIRDRKDFVEFLEKLLKARGDSA